jgi:hypothetical protein
MIFKMCFSLGFVNRKTLDKKGKRCVITSAQENRMDLQM